MATIRKRNGHWQAQIRKSGSRAISRTFTVKQDALFWAREQERILELQTDVLEKKTLLKKTLADLGLNKVKQLEGTILDSFTDEQVQDMVSDADAVRLVIERLEATNGGNTASGACAAVVQAVKAKSDDATPDDDVSVVVVVVRAKQ